MQYSALGAQEEVLWFSAVKRSSQGSMLRIAAGTGGRSVRLLGTRLQRTPRSTLGQQRRRSTTTTIPTSPVDTSRTLSPIAIASSMMASRRCGGARSVQRFGVQLRGPTDEGGRASSACKPVLDRGLRCGSKVLSNDAGMACRDPKQCDRRALWPTSTLLPIS
jgi:hypothetical protein